MHAPPIVLLPQPRRIHASEGTCPANATVTEHRESSNPRAESYALDIAPDRILLRAGDDAGMFYARQTLAQIRRQSPDRLPCLRIEDWPDFAHRGVMLDVSRDKVPTMRTLFELVDLFAHLKLNQLQL